MSLGIPGAASGDGSHKGDDTAPPAALPTTEPLPAPSSEPAPDPPSAESAEERMKRCITAPREPTKLVIGLEMGITEATDDPKAHRRAVDYLRMRLNKAYGGEAVHVTSSMADQCVRICVYIFKNSMVPLNNAIQSGALLRQMNDAYIMYERHPRAKQLNPRRLDWQVRTARRVHACSQLACLHPFVPDYQTTYGYIDVHYITCPADLKPFDTDNAIAARCFPAPGEGKGRVAAARAKRKAQKEDKEADEIIAFLTGGSGSGDLPGLSNAGSSSDTGVA